MKSTTVIPHLVGTAAIAVTATLVVGSGLPSGAAAEESDTLTFQLSEKRVASRYIDLGKSGPSIGDRHLTSVSLTKDGAIAGRVEIECVAVDRIYQGQTCDLVAQLADGTLYFEGVGFHRPVPHVGTGDDTVYAITGGSGAYAGAEGEVTIGLTDTGPVTITLLP